MKNVQRFMSYYPLVENRLSSRTSLRGGVEITPLDIWEGQQGKIRLTAEPVQGTSLSLECIHHIEGSDGLAACVFCVGDCIPDHILQKHLR